MKNLFRILLLLAIAYVGFVVWRNYIPARIPFTTAAPTPAAIAPPATLESFPELPQQVSVVRALYGPEGSESDVTEKVSAMLESGGHSIQADGQLFGFPSAPANKLTIVFVGPSGNFQISADEGKFITVPSTTTIVRNPRLAPPGVYFLLRYTSITTSDGVIGFNPGSRFTLLKNNGATMHVTDGQNQIDVSSALLTNDLVIAAAAYSQDAAAMAAFHQSNLRQAQVAAAAQAAAQPVATARPVKTYAAPADPAGNPLNDPAYNRHGTSSRIYYRSSN